MIAWLIYAFLAIFLQRQLLFTRGTIGHNWDWSIPDDPILLRQFFWQNLFAWNQHNLGQPKVVALSVQPVHLILSVWGYAGVSGEFISKFFVVLIHIVAAGALYLFVRDVLQQLPISSETQSELNIPSFIAGLFYGFSPFLFGELIGGGASVLVGYAVAPLAFLFLRRAVSRPQSRTRQLLLVAVVLSVVGSHHAYLMLLWLLLTVYCIQLARWRSIRF
jgi:hypothetical protein